MNAFHILLFVFAIPLFLAIGHDIYIFVINDFKEIQLSDLGFLWTKYSPESFRYAKDNLDPEIWNMIEQILSVEAIFVTAAFTGVVYVFLFLLYILGVFKTKSNYYSANRLNNMLGRKPNSLSKR